VVSARFTAALAGVPETSTVEDLGRKAKAKYPESYRSLSDPEVGRKVKSAWPGSYDNYADADVRVVQPGWGKLEAWVPGKDFKDMDYLDRKTLVESAGREWCGEASAWLLPLMTVRDLKSGKSLAVFHCLLSRSDMSPKNPR
jgi:hypothetical protein